MSYTHNHVVNGNLELWDAGPVPRFMDAQVTATTITTLDELVQTDEHHPWRHQWADIRPRNDKYVYEGFRALRAELTAAAIVDDFRLYNEGITAAMTGASVFDIKEPALDFGHRYSFTLAARCSVDGNLLRVRVALRDNTDTPRLYLDANGNWQTVSIVGATTIEFALRTTWRRFGLVSDPVPYVDTANGNIIENMVWQVSNATAGAQFIDLDDLWIIDAANSFAAP